jgi:hypothetical protein
MTKLEAVDDIRKALLKLISVQDSFADDDEAVRAFQDSYERLVDRFYQETHEILAYPQYQAAKNDPEYLMQLVLLAYHHYKDESVGRVLH